MYRNNALGGQDLPAYTIDHHQGNGGNNARKELQAHEYVNLWSTFPVCYNVQASTLTVNGTASKVIAEASDRPVGRVFSDYLC